MRNDNMQVFVTHRLRGYNEDEENFSDTAILVSQQRRYDSNGRNSNKICIYEFDEIPDRPNQDINRTLKT